jgi:MFS family permease
MHADRQNRALHADQNVRLLQMHAVCINMCFIIPIIIPYYRDRMGLGFDDFLLGEAAFAATLVLLEVPSGWLSDVWKRRHVLLLGTLFEMLGYGLLLFADGLWMAVAAQCVSGVGISLISGTNSALLYDSLLSEGREAEYRRHEGRRMGIGLYSVAAASLAGGLLYAVDARLPVLLSLVTLGAGAVCAAMLHEPERHRRAATRHPLADMLETARYALSGHVELGLVIVFAALMFSATKVVMWSQQPYYMAMGLGEHVYGLLMAAGFVLGGASSHFAHLLDGRVSNLKALLGVWLLGVVCCVGASQSLGVMGGWAGVGMLMLAGTCLYGLAAPRVSEVVNRHAGSARRATILSTQSLLCALVFMPLSLLMGRVEKDHGVDGMLLGMALWLCLAGLCLMLWCSRRRLRARRHAAMQRRKLAAAFAAVV